MADIADIERADRDGAVSTGNFVEAKDSQDNVKLVVDMGDKGTMEIPLTGKLVINLQQNSGVTSTMNSVGAKDSQNNVKLVVDLGDKGAMEIPLTGTLVVDLQRNSGVASTINSIGAKDSQNNVKLVVDLGDRGTMEIPLTGKLAVDPQHAEDTVRKLLMEMRGWIMTVGTLFVSMAFQAAMQPPGWMPHGDWLKVMRTTTGVSSSHADRPAMPAPSPNPPPAITVGQARRAYVYVYLNALTFGTALTLVTMLLVLTKNTPPRRTMTVVKLLVVILAYSVVPTFVMGISDVPRIMTIVSIVVVLLP